MGRLFKAMAFGNLIQVYEQVPLDVSPTNRAPEFADRAAVLAERAGEIPARATGFVSTLQRVFNVDNYPVLTLIEDRPGTFHYIVVVAVTDKALVFHDPARAPFRAPFGVPFRAP